MTQIIPLQSFLHGKLKAVQGKPVDVPDYLARDFCRAGLARLDLGVSEGKPELGEGPQSSVSPADPASPDPTVNLSEPGAKRKRKRRAGSSSPTPPSA